MNNQRYAIEQRQRDIKLYYQLTLTHARNFEAKTREAPPKQQKEKKAEKEKKKEEEEEYYHEEIPEEDAKEFKWYRRVAFLIGKAFKYTSWLTFSIFFYHMALIKKFKTPEDHYPTNEIFLRAARHIDWTIYDIKKVFTEPAMTKMLPDRPPGIPTRKTLVLNLKGTLVHQTYKLGVGAELYKRPGLTAFLSRCSQNYDMCIFGMGDAGEIMEVCMALDPNQEMIRGMFGRESTALKDGKYIKDLSYLNRPLKEVLYVDFSDEHVEYQPDNCIILPKFEGDPEDRELLDLIPFLDRKYNCFDSLITLIDSFIFNCRSCKSSRRREKRAGKIWS